MSFLKKLGLVEDVVETPEFDTNLLSSMESGVTDVMPEGQVVDTTGMDIGSLVSGIYQEAGFSETNNIFTIDNYLKALPAEMPTSTKQQTVAGILAVGKIDIYQLVEDGRSRLATLSSTMQGIDADNEQLRTEKNEFIESLKQQIADAEKEIAISKATRDASEKAIDDEIAFINELINFCSGIINPDNNVTT